MEETQSTKPFFEKSLLNWLLIICLVLGFVCIAAVYLPSKLPGNEKRTFDKNTPIASRLLALLPPAKKNVKEKLPPMQSKNGVYFRFVPEQEPNPPPYAAGYADNDKNSVLDENAAYEEPENEEMMLAQRAISTSTGKTHETSSLALYNPAEGTAKDSKKNLSFKVPEEFKYDVEFWKDIFAKYDSHQSVLHDTKYLEIVYGMLDFRYLDSNPLIANGERQRKKQDRIDAEKEKIINILEKLASNPSPNQLTEEELRIKKLFSRIEDPEKFAEAAKRGVRAQTGQRDKFYMGLKYSGRYLGEIEKIFEDEGLPRDLTRLIFVESMFNPSAHSSAGARGIWQFMHGTGKKYALRINSVVDERVDPIRATYAAAQLLRHNHDVLGNWPLAINAYNSGRGRLQQAVNRLGTRDITTIVRYFDHPSYGFASRNFYIEFLAVVDVVKNHKKYFPEITFDEPLIYDIVWLNDPINLPQVARLSKIDIGEIAELNPGYSASVFSGETPLPAKYELRVPQNKGKAFTAAAERAPVPLPTWHTVEKGESIEDIASLYNVKVSDIQRHNSKLGRNLRPGQRIRIAK